MGGGVERIGLGVDIIGMDGEGRGAINRMGSDGIEWSDRFQARMREQLSLTNHQLPSSNKSNQLPTGRGRPSQ